MFLKDLEQIIKDKYQDQSEQIDHDALWGKVYPEIKKDKKRPFLFWLLGTGVIALAIGIWFWSDAPATNSSNPANGLSEADQNAESEMVNELQEVKMIVQEMKESVEELQTQVEPSKADQSFSEPISNFQSVADPISSTQVNRPGLLNSYTATERVFYQETPTTSQRKLEVIPLAQSQKMANARRTSRNVIEGLNVLDFRSINLLDFDSSRNLKEYKVMVQERIEANSKKMKPSLDLLLGYGFINRSLTNDDSQHEMALRQRDAYEDPLEAISIDLLLNYPLSSKLLLRAGLDYQMITERTTHFFQTSEVITSDSVLISTYEDENGNVTSEFGVGEELLVNDITRTNYNYFHSLGLPMQLVVSHRLNRVKLEFGIGARLNVLFLKQGFIQTELNQEYSLDDDMDGYFDRGIKTDLLTDLGLIYDLNSRLSWNTRLQYSYGLNGIHSTSNPIEQKYNLIKIKTGLRYQF